MLSRDNIEKALADGHLKIFPFEKQNLTGIGYNISTTDFAFSINLGILLTVHQKTVENGVMRYVVIPGNDTVLFFSKEYIEVDKTLAGTFHSKVSCVSQGLGHISTTLDPTWKGQLLISVNNPTSNDIVFDLDKSGGNIVTLLLHKLDSPVTGNNIHDNNKGRCELLISHFATPSPTLKYKNKHLEVKEFVQKKLADSLNGYDNFLGSNQPQDRYSPTIVKLMNLQNRLELDRCIISEGRYKIEGIGKYYCIKNAAELDLLKSCALYELSPKLRETLSMQSKIIAGFEAAQLTNASPIIEIIDECIKVIEYELNMIDHVRRIQWQNDQVNRFAGEDSELVRLRRSVDKSRRVKRFWIPLFGIFAVVVGFFWVLIGPLDAFSEKSGTGAILSAIYAPILVFILERWWKYWHETT